MSYSSQRPHDLVKPEKKTLSAVGVQRRKWCGG
jgi:hypothetical protein